MGIERLYGILCDFMRLRHMFLLPPSMRMNSRLDRFILNKVQKPWSVGPWWLDIVTIVISGSFGRINLHQHPCPWYTIYIYIYIPAMFNRGFHVSHLRGGHHYRRHLCREAERTRTIQCRTQGDGLSIVDFWILRAFKGANFWTLHLTS